MDIRFLREFTPNVGYLFPKSSIHLSSTPATDVVSVGVGQIIKYRSIYVPTHGRNPAHLNKKIACPINDAADKARVDQIGGSSLMKNEKEEKDIVVEPNNKKARKMDKAIEASFLNPVIATGTLKVGLKSKITPKIKKSSEKSFKFRVID